MLIRKQTPLDMFHFVGQFFYYRESDRMKMIGVDRGEVIVLLQFRRSSVW